MSMNITSYAGFILGAHPGLRDPNFHQTVVLLSAHSAEEGALGVVINRPSDQCLGNLREDLETPVLRNLPVFEGGPVAADELLLAAWKWDLKEQNFRLFFGLQPEKLQELLESDPSIEARAFLGYAGWSAGQLEVELGRFDWAVSPFAQPYGKQSPQNLWRTLLNNVRPEWLVLADIPDDPSLN